MIDKNKYDIIIIIIYIKKGEKYENITERERAGCYS